MPDGIVEVLSRVSRNSRAGITLKNRKEGGATNAADIICRR